MFPQLDSLLNSSPRLGVTLPHLPYMPFLLSFSSTLRVRQDTELQRV